MKILTILIMIVILSFVLMNCEKISIPGKAENTEPEVKVKIANPADSHGAVYLEFVQVRMVKPTDFNALNELYKNKLSSFVKSTDKANRTAFDPAIQKALDDALAGKDLFINAQIAEKTIQHAFIRTFKKALNDTIDGKNPEQAKNDILNTRRILGATAQRRDKWLKGEAQFDSNYTEMLLNFEQAVEQGNIEKAKALKSQIDTIVNKVLLLSVFYELEGLSLARGKNEDKAGEKRVEALIYHNMILDEHRKLDPGGAATVTKQLSGSVDQIDIQLVQDLLSTAFSSQLAGIDKGKLGK